MSRLFSRQCSNVAFHRRHESEEVQFEEKSNIGGLDKVFKQKFTDLQQETKQMLQGVTNSALVLFIRLRLYRTFFFVLKRQCLKCTL